MSNVICTAHTGSHAGTTVVLNSQSCEQRAPGCSTVVFPVAPAAWGSGIFPTGLVSVGHTETQTRVGLCRGKERHWKAIKILFSVLTECILKIKWGKNPLWVPVQVVPNMHLFQSWHRTCLAKLRCHIKRLLKATYPVQPAQGVLYWTTRNWASKPTVICGNKTGFVHSSFNTAKSKAELLKDELPFV